MEGLTMWSKFDHVVKNLTRDFKCAYLTTWSKFDHMVKTLTQDFKCTYLTMWPNI